MRFPVRRITQVVAVLACFMVTNLLVILFNPGREISEDSADFRGNSYESNGENLLRNPRAVFDDSNKNNADIPGRKVSSVDKLPVDLSEKGARHGVRVKGGASVFQTDPIQTIEGSDTQSNLHLQDLFISVKTTGAFHKSRLRVLIDTWVSLAKSVTYFFTDVNDEQLSKETGGHVINTNCSSVHTRKALCCKMSVEFDSFIASKRKWFCHVDDDTYVNVPTLLALLRQYNHTEDWYLGKPSLNHPLEIRDIEAPQTKTLFWFATGGAGFCISRALALKMMPYTGGGKLNSVCDKIRLPDDCTIGFIIYHYLKKKLTVITEFHSHLEGLWMIKPKIFRQQITMSYNRKNLVPAPGFPLPKDPSRFRSIHCHLFPRLEQCEGFMKS